MPSRTGGKTASTSKKKATSKKTAAKKATKTKARSAKKKTTRRKTAVKKSTNQVGRGAGKLRVRQVRSGIGSARVFRHTLRALGLKHHQDEVVVPDNPSIRGMINKVHYLVTAEPEEENV
ncbi:MAG: 50S ribosomal protein L30 [Gemmatimonadota bacterium]|nr:MAG: 50S ribosomal protein L30 [Gemmatimonadota bacterium]